jgi:hypothetical protein
LPNLREAAVAVGGTIIDVSDARNLDGSANGTRVVLSTGDGFLSLRLKIEDAARVRPIMGNQVAWLVRYGMMQGENGGIHFATYVRDMTEDDLDRLNSALQRSLQPVGK